MSGIYKDPRHEAARKKYQPTRIKLLFIAESPPGTADRFFYFEDVKRQDSLFWEMMKVIYGVEKVERSRKKDLLERFSSDGFHLIDAVPTPLAAGSKAVQIRAGTEALKRDIRQLCASDVPVVLISKNVYECCVHAISDGYTVLNDAMLPFPGSGNQRRFRAGLRKTLSKYKL